MQWLLALIPGVGPALATGVSILSNRFAQIGLAALLAFIWGHRVADKSSALREANRERAVLAAQLKETERQRKAAEAITAATEADLGLLAEQDRINRKRIADYEKTPPKPGDPCAIDDAFRRRLRDINSGR